jgi:hypothetical protein
MVDTTENKKNLYKEVKDMLDGVMKREEARDLRIGNLEDKVKGSNDYYNKEIKDQEERSVNRHRFLVRCGQWLVVLFVGVFCSMAAFSYKTYKQDHTEVKDYVKSSQDKFGEWHKKDVQALDDKFTLELNTVKNDIAELKSSIKSVDDKADKILHILIKKK